MVLSMSVASLVAILEDYGSFDRRKKPRGALSSTDVLSKSAYDVRLTQERGWSLITKSVEFRSLYLPFVKSHTRMTRLMM